MTIPNLLHRGMFLSFTLHDNLDDDALQSAKTNLNVEQVFFSIARDIKQMLAETDTKSEGNTAPKPGSF